MPVGKGGNLRKVCYDGTWAIDARWRAATDLDSGGTADAGVILVDEAVQSAPAKPSRWRASPESSRMRRAESAGPAHRDEEAQYLDVIDTSRTEREGVRRPEKVPAAPPGNPRGHWT
jgi:hypothetical protein